MSKPISPAEIDWKLLSLIDRMESDVEEFETLYSEAAKAEAEYKLRYAETYVTLDPSLTVKEKESWSAYKTGELHRDYVTKEALVKSKRARLDSNRSQCDALRTLAANVREQI